MHIACACRMPQDLAKLDIPEEIADCFRKSANSAPRQQASMRLALPTGNQCFWPMAAFLRDVFEAAEGQLAAAAKAVGISTANLAAFLTSHGNLLEAAQAIRKTHGHSPLR